jgi:flagellar biosynthetic protein FliR
MLAAGDWLAEGALRQLWLAALLAMARLVPMIWFVPFWGGRLVPATAKTALSLLFGLLLYPLIAPALQSLGQAPATLVVAVLIKEVAVGFALAFVVGLVFYAAQSAGWLIDLSRGANLAETLVPQGGGRSSPLGTLYLLLAVVLFLSLGGHHLFIAAMGHAYQAVPLLAFPAVDGLRAFAALCGRLNADMILIALSLAAPVVATLLLVDLVLGWLNRFAPQFNVFFLAMPLKALVGIGVVVLSVGLLLGALPPLLETALGEVDRALRLLGGR